MKGVSIYSVADVAKVSICNAPHLSMGELHRTDKK
jgi:hypothetical protein